MFPCRVYNVALEILTGYVRADREGNRVTPFQAIGGQSLAKILRCDSVLAGGGTDLFLPIVALVLRGGPAKLSQGRFGIGLHQGEVEAADGFGSQPFSVLDQG